MESSSVILVWHDVSLFVFFFFRLNVWCIYISHNKNHPSTAASFFISLSIIAVFFEINFLCFMIIYESDVKTVKPEVTTTCLSRPPLWTSHFEHLLHKVPSEQRPPVNSGHLFEVPRVVVHMFDYTSETQVNAENASLNWSWQLGLDANHTRKKRIDTKHLSELIFSFFTVYLNGKFYSQKILFKITLSM